MKYMQCEYERLETMKAAEYKDGKTIYRDMTAEEVAEMEAMQASAPKPEQSAAERVAALEAQVAAMSALLAQKGG